jgi:beta-galactosidase
VTPRRRGSTGWLTWVGDGIANKSVTKMVTHFREILAYANGTGSINLYMAAGGTNFGFTAGARPARHAAGQPASSGAR